MKNPRQSYGHILIAGAFSLLLLGSVADSILPASAQTQDRIYGSELMTEQERNEHRQRMRNAGTPEERERIRNENHERMSRRAKERGVTLPDEPMMPGMGRGSAPGRGMGPGRGAGQGGQSGGGRR